MICCFDEFGKKMRTGVICLVRPVLREGEAMKTLLLVDDELENRRSLGEILRRFDYEVIDKPDARSALSAIREGNSVDLVITDYRMP